MVVIGRRRKGLGWWRPTATLTAIVAVGLVVAAGCGSGASSGPRPGLGLGGSTTSAVPASASVRPSWAEGLGPGVTIVPPQAHPGAGSPGALVFADYARLVAGDYTGMCARLEPSVQAKCKQGVAGKSGQGNSVQITNLAVGYVAIEGDEALLGTTGSFCDDAENPPCVTNNDPAALFAGGKTFDVLYSQAVDSGNSDGDSNVYSLVPCIRVNGKWYAFTPSSDL